MPTYFHFYLCTNPLLLYINFYNMVVTVSSYGEVLRQALTPFLFSSIINCVFYLYIQVNILHCKNVKIYGFSYYAFLA